MASTQGMDMFIFLHVPTIFTLIISYHFQSYMASTLLKMIDMFIDQEQAPKDNYATRRYARLTNEQREKHVQHVMQNQKKRRETFTCYSSMRENISVLIATFGNEEYPSIGQYKGVLY